jgi:hypothetical protein
MRDSSESNVENFLELNGLLDDSRRLFYARLAKTIYPN